MSPALNSFNLQLVAEISFLGCISVITIFIWIGVRPTSIHAFILFAVTGYTQWNVHQHNKKSSNGKWKLFKRSVDIYMVCLTVFQLPFARLIDFAR